MLRGCWLLPPSWLLASLDEGRFLPEAPHMLHDAFPGAALRPPPPPAAAANSGGGDDHNDALGGGAVAAPPPPPPLATAALGSAAPSGADDLTLMIERIKAQGTEQTARPWGGGAP